MALACKCKWKPVIRSTARTIVLHDVSVTMTSQLSGRWFTQTAVRGGLLIIRRCGGITRNPGCRYRIYSSRVVYGEQSDTGRTELEITTTHTSPTTIDPSDHEGHGARETPVVTQWGSRAICTRSKSKIRLTSRMAGAHIYTQSN